MKLKIVKNVEFPKDVSEEYLPVWDAFLKMRAVAQLRVIENADLAVPECFRLLTKQIGAKVPLLYTVKDFVRPQTPLKHLREFLRRGGVLDHMRVVRHKQSLQYTEAAPVCALYNPVFEGIVVLRAQRFDLKYLIGRMQGLVYKNLPYQLNDKMPNGDPKKMRKLNGLSDKDFVVLFDAHDLTISMARTDKELVVKYAVKLKVIVPLYQRADVALKDLWRKSIIGVFV